MADLKARELRGRLQGPPAAWPTCDPFRQRPSVSMPSRIPRPGAASCVADFRGPRVRVADIKARQLRGRHKGAGAEVEEARAGRAPPAPTTWHPRRRSRTANTRRAREGTCMQGQCQGMECQHQFCLGRGRPRNTDLRSSRIINCTSVLRRRASRQRRRVRIIASKRYAAVHFCSR